MKMNKEDYAKLVTDTSPKSKPVKDCICAFLVGGAICVIGEVIKNRYISMGLTLTDAGIMTSVTLISISGILTMFGLYHKIADFAGAGTLVPITGFANAVVSPAIEFKTEGFVMGTGAKMFVIAGPVIVYGITASVIWGTIYYIIRIIGG